MTTREWNQFLRNVRNAIKGNFIGIKKENGVIQIKVIDDTLTVSLIYKYPEQDTCCMYKTLITYEMMKIHLSDEMGFEDPAGIGSFGVEFADALLNSKVKKEKTIHGNLLSLTLDYTLLGPFQGKLPLQFVQDGLDLMVMEVSMASAKTDDTEFVEELDDEIDALTKNFAETKIESVDVKPPNKNKVSGGVNLFVKRTIKRAK